MSRETIILLGHGSRRIEANDILRSIVKIIKPKFPDEYMECAFLEFAEPNINDALENAANGGSNLIYVIPYFLYSGNHVSRDIPNILKEFSVKYPNVNIKYGDYLGIDEKLSELAIERIMAVKRPSSHG
ncbi:sirohydrochlorin chelatase [Candidatus Acidulodesulfobacterium sp. H_13]|uniref:sirohydrochlorin chelatase n=1 Tax=Candidatus Acidulodesulfobacterium sp. H_13 TaxID=3395470 RepID=UPI003AF5C602